MEPETTPSQPERPERLVRLDARITREQADALEVRDDGSVRVPAELYRVEKPPKNQKERDEWNRGIFYITQEFVEKTFSRWNRVPLVDSHEADWDANPARIGGWVEVDKIKGREKATHGFLETDPDTPMGQQMAGLIKRHVAWVQEGSREVVALSIDAVRVVLDPTVNVMETDPPWPIIDGEPHHVMLTIAGMQAEPNAGIRATIARQAQDYFGDEEGAALAERLETQRLMNSAPDNAPDGDKPSEGTTMEPEKELEATKAELERTQADLAAANAALETARADLEAATNDRDDLRKTIEDQEKEELREEITRTLADIEVDPPAGLDEMDLSRLKAESLAALRKHRDTIASLPGRRSPVSPPSGEATSEREAELKRAREEGEPFALTLEGGDE